MSSLDDLAAVFLLAVALDRFFGEPSNRFHPTAWMGRLIAFFTATPVGNRYFYGMFMFTAVTVIFSGGALLIMKSLHGGIPALVAGSLILKLQFSWRALGDHARPIGELVAEGDTEGAKEGLQGIVGRDTLALDGGQIISATVESIGESTPDGIISPLFYYLFMGSLLGMGWGVAAAVFFRAASTLDSMVGYRTEELEEIGWFSAKSDDVLNYIPARLSAIFLILSSALLWRTGSQSLRVLRRDRRNPKSPNSGYPMAALAGGIGVRLEKPGSYVIGAGLLWPMGVEKVGKALRTVDLAIVLFMITSLGYLMLP
jgi:adenosylcobinamide-phosphate synthase